NNFSNLSENLVVNSFQNMEDALVSFTSTGRLEFRDFANAIMADITRIAVRMLIIRPLLGLFGKAFNFDGAPVPGDADFIGPLQKEKGGDIKGGITYLVNEKKVEKSSVPGYFRPLNSDKVF